jgi:hypothetical protein
LVQGTSANKGVEHKTKLLAAISLIRATAASLLHGASSAGSSSSTASSRASKVEAQLALTPL